MQKWLCCTVPCQVSLVLPHIARSSRQSLGAFLQCLGFRKYMYWTWVIVDSKMCGLNPQSASPNLDRSQRLPGRAGWEGLSAHIPCAGGRHTWCCRREALSLLGLPHFSFHELQPLIAAGDVTSFHIRYLCWQGTSYAFDNI